MNSYLLVKLFFESVSACSTSSESVPAECTSLTVGLHVYLKEEVVIRPCICMRVCECCSKCCRGVTKTLWIKVSERYALLPNHWNVKVEMDVLHVCCQRELHFISVDIISTLAG